MRVLQIKPAPGKHVETHVAAQLSWSNGESWVIIQWGAAYHDKPVTIRDVPQLIADGYTHIKMKYNRREDRDQWSVYTFAIADHHSDNRSTSVGRNSGGDDIVHVECIIKNQTAKAVCVVQDEDDGGEDQWVPLSQVTELGDGFIKCKRWLAETKGLSYAE